MASFTWWGVGLCYHVIISFLRQVKMTLRLNHMHSFYNKTAIPEGYAIELVVAWVFYSFCKYSLTKITTLLHSYVIFIYYTLFFKIILKPKTENMWKCIPWVKTTAVKSESQTHIVKCPPIYIRNWLNLPELVEMGLLIIVTFVKINTRGV
jgi:hypothetical protein